MDIRTIQRLNEIMYCKQNHSCPTTEKIREAQVYNLACTIMDQFNEAVLIHKNSPPENIYFELLSQLSDSQEFLYSQLGLALQDYKEALRASQDSKDDECKNELIKSEFERKLSDMLSLLRIWIETYKKNNKNLDNDQ